ncbi:MAG: pyridoxamine 5'-phosphate oxidase family protein [Rikenellaceae bacterium]
MQSKITDFIERHHVMTLATSSELGVYCSNAFYAFNREAGALIFTTNSETTRHGAEMRANPQVAVSIVLESKIVGKIQGAQIVGRVEQAQGGDKEIYLKAFPYATFMPLELWRVDIESVKLTDNTLGFGKKLIWNRE